MLWKRGNFSNLKDSWSHFSENINYSALNMQTVVCSGTFHPHFRQRTNQTDTALSINIWMAYTCQPIPSENPRESWALKFYANIPIHPFASFTLSGARQTWLWLTFARGICFFPGWNQALPGQTSYSCHLSGTSLESRASRIFPDAFCISNDCLGKVLEVDSVGIPQNILKNIRMIGDGH